MVRLWFSPSLFPVTETPLDSMCLETENITVYRVRGDRWKEAPGAWREGAQHWHEGSFFFPRIFSFQWKSAPQEYCLFCYFSPSLGIPFSSLLWFSTSSSGLPWWVSCKEPACQCRRCKRHGFHPWVRKTPWRRKRQPTPVFLPEIPMDRGAWRATVRGVAENQTGLRD